MQKILASEIDGNFLGLALELCALGICVPQFDEQRQYFVNISQTNNCLIA